MGQAFHPSTINLTYGAGRAGKAAMVLICRHFPANKKIHFSANSAPRAKRVVNIYW
jgi:hypothetical protein